MASSTTDILSSRKALSSGTQLLLSWEPSSSSRQALLKPAAAAFAAADANADADADADADARFQSALNAKFLHILAIQVEAFVTACAVVRKLNTKTKCKSRGERAVIFRHNSTFARAPKTFYELEKKKRSSNAFSKNEHETEVHLRL